MPPIAPGPARQTVRARHRSSRRDLVFSSFALATPVSPSIVAKAKAEGKYKGRAPTARAKASEVLRLRGEGVGPTEIGQRLKIGRASVYRILRTPAD